jgi:translocation and assembly module TamB
MSRKTRLLLFGLLLALVGLVGLLRTEKAAQVVCDELRERLPGALGADVRIERCVVEPLSLAVRVVKLEVTPKGAGAPLLTADEAEVAFRGLFFGGVALQKLVVRRPSLSLDLSAPTTVAPAAAPGPRACPVDALKAVRINQLEINDAHVSVLLPEGRSVVLEGLTLHAQLSRHALDLDLSARGGVLTASLDRPLRLGRLATEASLALAERELEISRADVNVEGVTASLSGKLEDLCDVVPQLALGAQVYVPMGALPRLGLPLEAPTGQLWARATLGGRLDAPNVRAQLEATQVAFGEFTPGDFSARVAWSGALVKVEDFTTRSGDGEIHVSGEVKLQPGYPVKVQIETREASFARVLDRAGIKGAWVEFPATVKASLSGKLAPVGLGGDVDFHTGAFHLASRAWNAPASVGRRILDFKRAEGHFRFGVNPQGVTFDEVQVRAGVDNHTRVRGSVKLFFDAARGLELSAEGDNLDLSDFEHISELPWSGQGTAKVEIAGPLGGITVNGQLSLRDFELSHYSLGVVQSPIHYAGETLSFNGIVAQKGRTQYFGDVALIFQQAGLYARASVQLPDGRVEDVVDLLADLSPVMQNVQNVLVGQVSAVAAVDSPASELNGVIALDVHDAEYFDRRLGAGTAIVRFDHGDALVLEPTVFTGPLGRFSVDGRWRFDGPLDFRLSLDDGALKEVNDPKGLDGTPIAGVCSARATVFGDTDLVRSKGTFACDDVIWKGHGLGPMKLDLGLVGRDLTVSGDVVGGVSGRLTSKTRGDWPYEGTFDGHLGELSAFLPENAGLAASMDFTVKATGPLKTWRDSRADISLSKVQVSRGEVSLANQEPVSLVYDANNWEVKKLALRGPTTELVAQGRWGPGSVDLSSRGSIDLRLLPGLVSSLERTSGRLDFTAAFSGPVGAPTLAGTAELIDARASVVGQDLTVRALSGHADFSESRVLFQDVQGFLNDGRLRLRGDVKLEKLALSTAEVQADLEEVTVQLKPELPATLSGALLFARKGSSSQLSGALEVVKFRYTQPLQLESLLSLARKASVPQDEKPVEWLRYDVDLTTGNDVRIENNLARMRLVGKLKLTGTNVKPVLVGAIEAADGAQAFFRGNTFSVTRGLLQFNGLVPTFDLSAQSQVREYLVNVKAFGRFEDPKISFSSEPMLSDADVVSLLTVGVTTREKFASQSGASLAAEALLSASGLDQQVQRFLSQSVGLKDQQVRLTTTFNEATGTAEPSVTWESKVLSDNLKVGVTQPVTGRGTKAQAEYRFNQNVSARAQWDNQNQNTSVGNPGVDLKFRFEWE